MYFSKKNIHISNFLCNLSHWFVRHNITLVNIISRFFSYLINFQFDVVGGKRADLLEQKFSIHSRQRRSKSENILFHSRIVQHASSECEEQTEAAHEKATWRWENIFVHVKLSWELWRLKVERVSLRRRIWKKISEKWEWKKYQTRARLGRTSAQTQVYKYFSKSGAHEDRRVKLAQKSQLIEVIIMLEFHGNPLEYSDKGTI